MEKITLINQTIKKFFQENTSVKIILAKDLMPQFVAVGIFEKDVKNGLPIRKVLRSLDEKQLLNLIPYAVAERKPKNTNWFFSSSGKSAEVIVAKQTALKLATIKVPKINKERNSDEDYVLDLCDEVLKIKGSRQHKFDFLKGDAGTKLPVDIYYDELKLVVEYREYQHTNAVKHFDKPDKLTVSGVHRGEQRKIYDLRRRDVLPENGIGLIEIDYTDFNHFRNKIVRDCEKDLEIVRNKLKL